MAAVESELWNIFTFYTLHGNPLDPEHMTSQQFVKMAKDCSIVDVAADGTTLVASPARRRRRGEDADPHAAQHLQVADVSVCYVQVVKKSRRAHAVGTAWKKANMMTYNDFLNALMQLSVKVYPGAPVIDDAFQQLLMENVLPLASRRNPDNVDAAT